MNEQQEKPAKKAHNFKDLTGQKFGSLTVIKRVENNKHGKAMWLCRCKCGNELKVLGNDLRNGHTSSCGCLQKKRTAETNRLTKTRDDILGHRFGKLVAVEKLTDANGHLVYRCKCDCGGEKLVTESADLRNGRIKSCGCLTVKHGLTGTRIYNIWGCMKERCYKTYHGGYHNYGGRGIRVCDEWLDEDTGFINFYNWAMANGYRDDLSIDRINTNGNYEPSNCRWATVKQQQNNMRTNVYLERNGVRCTAKQFSERFNIPYHVVLKRYHEYGNDTVEVLMKEFSENFTCNNRLKQVRRAGESR